MTVPIDLTRNHLDIVHQAARRAEHDPTQSLVAIVFAAAAFEGWLASFVTHATSHAEHGPPPIVQGAAAIAETLPALERTNAQWTLKLQVASALLTGKPINRGEQPWQDVELLFRLRNLIVHPSLTWLPAPIDDPKSEPHVVIKALVSRGIVPAPEPISSSGLPGSTEGGRDLHPPPIIVLFRPEVAVWAERTAVAGLRAVTALAPESSFRTNVNSWLENFVLRRLAG